MITTNTIYMPSRSPFDHFYKVKFPSVLQEIELRASVECGACQSPVHTPLRVKYPSNIPLIPKQRSLAYRFAMPGFITHCFIYGISF